MEFDKNKILTVVTADQAKVGQKGWFGDTPIELETKFRTKKPYTIEKLTENVLYPFEASIGPTALFYPAPESSYRPYNNDELNDLVGKVLTSKYSGYNKLVTEQVANIAVRVGDSDCTAKDLFHYFTLDGKPCGVREEA